MPPVLNLDRLTPAEKRLRTTLESVIAANAAGFMAVGVALEEIRSKRLYRDQYATFEAYCQERWNFTRQRAAQHINAADVADSLSTIVDSANITESQARELVPLPPPLRRQVFAQASAEAADKARREGKPAARPTAARLGELAGAALLESLTPQQRKERVEQDDADRRARVAALDDEKALRRFGKLGRKVDQGARFAEGRGKLLVAEKLNAAVDSIVEMLGPERAALERLPIRDSA